MAKKVSTFLWVLLPTVILLVLLGWPSAAAAESQALSCSPLSLTPARLEAKKLLDNAEQDPDRGSRVRSLEAAYRIYQDPLILYNLGMLWFGAGRKTEGADILRRYLFEAGSQVPTQRRDRLVKIIEKFTGKGSRTGELLITSEPCAFVYVDGHLVGRVPLSLPLAMRPGPHVVEVEKDHRRKKEGVVMGTGQRTVHLRLPASVVLLAEGVPAADAERLQQAASEGASAEGVTPITGKARDAIIQKTAPLKDCLHTQPCKEELARLVQAQYVLVVGTESTENGRLLAHLLDVDAGAQSVSQGAPCPGCGAEEQAKRMAQLARDVLKAGLSTPKGTLELTSVPEAEVAIDGRKLGKTPFLRSALSGAHTVQLTAVGYRPHETRVQVETGKRTTVEVILRVEGEPAVSGEATVAMPFQAPRESQTGEKRDETLAVVRGGREPRPKWRLALGGIAAGAGVGLLTLGGLAISVNGLCGPASAPAMPMPGQMCSQTYDSLGAGVAMLATGTALTATGLLLVVWPGKAR